MTEDRGPMLDPGRCKACKAPIWWVRHKGGASFLAVNQEVRRAVTLETQGDLRVAVYRETYTPHAYTCPAERKPSKVAKPSKSRKGAEHGAL